MVSAVAARLTLALCLLSALAPVLLSERPPADQLLAETLALACILVPTSLPLLGLGVGAWARRRSEPGSLAFATAAAACLAVGYAGWWIGLQDPKGINAIGSMILVPLGQAVIWGIAVAFAPPVFSAAPEAEPGAAPDPAT